MQHDWRGIGFAFPNVIYRTGRALQTVQLPIQLSVSPFGMAYVVHLSSLIIVFDRVIASGYVNMVHQNR